MQFFGYNKKYNQIRQCQSKVDVGWRLAKGSLRVLINLKVARFVQAWGYFLIKLLVSEFLSMLKNGENAGGRKKV